MKLSALSPVARRAMFAVDEPTVRLAKNKHRTYSEVRVQNHPKLRRMAFTFLHTADWHIGKAFGSFEPDKQSILRRARLAAIDRLAAAAQARGIGHVIVCGDIFDAPGLADDLLLSVRARLASHPELTWHLLPGNHDAGQGDGIWSRFAKFGLPHNVNLLLQAAPFELVPGVVLLPAPVPARSVSRDLTAWMDAAPTPTGTIRIGVAHGSARGFGSDAAASIAISPQRRISARLDYLALGDWHGVTEIAAGVWYSGTPEPEQFPDNEPGYALAVTIDAAGASPRVERVAIASHTWMKRSYMVSKASDLDGLEAEIAKLGYARSELLLELTLAGTVTLEADADIAARLAALTPTLFHLRHRLDGLRLDTGADDLASLADQQLVSVARQLIDMRGTGPNGDIAESALRRLFTFARQAESAAQ
jgi:DNA repair exonuclease SbcCD nuclease subunit